MKKLLVLSIVLVPLIFLAACRGGQESLGSVDETVKAVNIAGTAPTLENMINGSYKLTRPFILIIKGQPSEKAKKFIDFILSGEGQKIVKEKGYVPVN